MVLEKDDEHQLEIQQKYPRRTWYEKTAAWRSSKQKASTPWHILRGSGSTLTLQIIEGKVEGKRRSRGRQKKQWYDNTKDWTGLSLVQAKRLA